MPSSAVAADNVIVLFPGPQPRKLSEILEQLIAGFAMRPVTLREVIVVLQGRAYNLLMLLLAIPFLLPLPLPGLSTLLGLVIAFIALRMTLGQKPWLPARLLDRELPPRFFPTLLSGARRVLRFLEVMLKPRQLWLTTSPLLIQLHAFIIFVAACVLLLPLPPGTNFPPALCIVIMAGGLLERDGRFILAGYLAFAFNAVFFALFAVYGQRVLQWLWALFAG
ncbi:exopolysaccharide biosynthesis protein [Rariglobus hedericola]|uniref:exopolysaccharide biosynthesis protein n=1 Tax=Rariglobus hedericola TaxID=2597822 RepID=UPI001396B630|nr:exopolysaccharide biosynthesis protein [Rariglobus hedericola]